MKEYYLEKGTKSSTVILLFGATHRENHTAVFNFLGMPEIYHQVHWAQTLRLTMWRMTLCFHVKRGYSMSPIFTNLHSCHKGYFLLKD